MTRARWRACAVSVVFVVTSTSTTDAAVKALLLCREKDRYADAVTQARRINGFPGYWPVCRARHTGHVRAYHGKRTLPKTHVARTRIAMSATTDYWVNDAAGEPLLGADLLRRRKPDRFREVGFGGAFRIDHLRVAFAV
jgi:hypothetical protein